MKDLRVSVIQANLHWRSIEANLASFEEKIWQIQGQQDVIILPEMFTTGFTMEPEDLAEPVNGNTYRWLTQMAKQTGAMVMGSAIIKEQGAYYNRLIAADAAGSIETYDKKHLFTLAGEDGQFTAGEKRLLLNVGGWRILPLICYDLRFPVWSRSRVTDNDTFEFDLVVYCANWPSARVQSWDSLLKARAIENSAYSIGVNRVGIDGYEKPYSGHSGVYNFLGDTLAFNEGEETTLTFSLSAEKLLKYRERYPFQRDSDAFNIV